MKRWLYYWFLAPRNQRWFWAKEWQARERGAEQDIRAGRTKTFQSFEEFAKELQGDE